MTIEDQVIAGVTYTAAPTANPDTCFGCAASGFTDGAFNLCSKLGAACLDNPITWVEKEPE